MDRMWKRNQSKNVVLRTRGCKGMCTDGELNELHKEEQQFDVELHDSASTVFLLRAVKTCSTLW
jgi:hypothetical protein